VVLQPRPLIAINGLLVGDTERALKLANRYADAVLKHGGIPVAIPPVGGPSDIERLLERVDGVVLSGGDDFDTTRLGLGPVHAKAQLTLGDKQEFDLALARTIIANRMPVLGICYGMQLLGIAEGATLHQHIPDDRPGSQAHSGGVVHPVDVDEGSQLARILRQRSIDVTSRHHQALASLRAPWRVCARDREGLIEAIARADQSFAIGVQWHPELSPEGSPNDRLFQGLVGAAAIAATQRLMSARA
jgi:putative glutamine amidotransferase